MRAECTAALKTQRMPTTRNEEYRFTDITPLLQLEPQVHLVVRTGPIGKQHATALACLCSCLHDSPQSLPKCVLPHNLPKCILPHNYSSVPDRALKLHPMQVAETADVESATPFVEAHVLKGAAARLVFVDGILVPELCAADGLPEGAYVGSASHAPDDLASQHLVRRSHACKLVACRGRGCLGLPSVQWSWRASLVRALHSWVGAGEASAGARDALCPHEWRHGARRGLRGGPCGHAAGGARARAVYQHWCAHVLPLDQAHSAVSVHI